MTGHWIPAFAGMTGGQRERISRTRAFATSPSRVNRVSRTTSSSMSRSILYQHFGYEIVANVRVDADLQTWGFFRPDRVQT